jgi:hypothetical protein
MASEFRRGLTPIREGERLQAGAHARVRELATMTAAEPETRLVSRHNAAQAACPRGFRACTAQREKGRYDEVAPRGRADPPADEVQTVSLLGRLTKHEDLLTISQKHCSVAGYHEFGS